MQRCSSGAGAMALRFVLDRRGGQGRTMGVHEVLARPFATVAVGVVGGLIVGMTSVGSGSLMIVLLLFLYPAIGAGALVGTDLTQAVPLTLAAALGQLAFGHVEFGVTASPIVIGSDAGGGRRLAALLDRPRPLRPSGDLLRDPRLRSQVRGARDDGARLDAVRRAARRRDRGAARAAPGGVPPGERHVATRAGSWRPRARRPRSARGGPSGSPGRSTEDGGPAKS